MTDRLLLHDWSRVDAGIFHNFHLLWIGRLDAVLNEELLPEPFYALAENVLGGAAPDVIALEARSPAGGEGYDSSRLTSDESAESPVALAPVAVIVQELTSPEQYAPLARRIVIRDRLRGDRVVAIIEIVSRANKDAEARRERFVAKCVESLRTGIHLVIIDIQPATALVPDGFHGLISEAFGNPVPDIHPGRVLQTVSYQVLEDGVVRAHVVPLAVGDGLPEMPVFLLPHHFVRLPLSRTYTGAFGSLPRHVKAALEA